MKPILKDNFSLFAKRRKDLITQIKQDYPEVTNGLVMLIAGFESDRSRFWQESTFFYYTGITEPGVILTIDLQSFTTLYLPNCADTRAQWVHSPIALTQENAKNISIDTITILGDRVAGFQIYPYSNMALYKNIMSDLENLSSTKGTLFTLYPKNEHGVIEQRVVIDRFKQQIPALGSMIKDISPIIAAFRRKKDMLEIDYLAKAIEITELAHEAAAQAIEDGLLECEVQASLEYMMLGAQSRPAFPSIVATGKNATILHYQENNQQLKAGQLVVVDIGASWQGYCADITRTYPVSGTFTDRQKKLYNLVLEVQNHIAENAIPGMYLKNASDPEKSLHHLAVAYFKKHGYEKYFTHGIGHYLGLDVHDVGDYTKPLQEGDVFTIEPGLYIPEEGIGVRIEDDYWMAKNGAICLSEHLPKTAEDIEAMVQQSFDDERDQEDELQEAEFESDEREFEDDEDFEA